MQAVVRKSAGKGFTELLSVDAAGICYDATAKGTRCIGWSDITWVGAFKRSNEAGEFNCIWIRSPKEEFPVEFDAREPMWDTLAHAMPRHLRGFRPLEKWFPPSLHPTLEINMQNVYERA